MRAACQLTVLVIGTLSLTNTHTHSPIQLLCTGYGLLPVFLTFSSESTVSLSLSLNPIILKACIHLHAEQQTHLQSTLENLMFGRSSIALDSYSNN